MGVARLSAIAASLLFVACSSQPQTPTSSLPPPASSSGSPSPSPIPDEPVLVEVGSFDQPIYVASPAKDQRLFVVEKAGKVKVMKGTVIKTFLDITGEVSSSGERGLFSIAFPPEYAGTGSFYVSYTDRNGDSRIVEYKASSDPDVADVSTKREILFIKQPFPNHNGGLIVFDPSGMLVFGLGDGGSGGDPGNRAQNLGEKLGKLLRIDPRTPSEGRPYSVPKDNPFVGKAGVAPEVLAYGLRNPWRFWFDPRSADLWLADVGQNRYEEVNFVTRDKTPGANFGWRKYEGNSVFSQQNIDESKLVKPVHVYPTGPAGTCAVTGGQIYRGEVNKIQGLYLYADVCEGIIRGLSVTQGTEVVETGLKAEQIVSFGQDSSDQVYVVSLSGKVYKISKKTH